MNVTDCLANLAETDDKAANAKALMKGLELNLKRVKAYEFLQAQGTVAEREHKAYDSEQYKETAQKYQNAIADYEILANQRNTWTLGFEYWRSNNANRRQAGGNL